MSTRHFARRTLAKFSQIPRLKEATSRWLDARTREAMRMRELVPALRATVSLLGGRYDG